MFDVHFSGTRVIKKDGLFGFLLEWLACKCSQNSWQK